ncbi:hypothetical protein SAMN05421858_4832 [Haladaptatus litoreus]|uniref:C2H2-type domain-containing protein n=1 Tax=Haladaptatus litoreus TaxID=553468 RepID=A0A1N7F9B4_9EURY|nr:hypothetical protein [Haladaptatus litoreus]SIR96815.1 hypothetical protein SAMN05421858_4832 [Haladaptatus litoreus]
MHRSQIKRVLEFFVIGIVFGVTEDILAVLIATDAELTFDIVGVVVLIAIPFAIISELIVDHPKFLTFDKISVWLNSSIFGRFSVQTRNTPGTLQKETAPWPHHQYYCDICNTELETGALLQEHLDRHHTDIHIYWSIHADEARQ